MGGGSENTQTLGGGGGGAEVTMSLYILSPDPDE